ncbi:MAG: ferritin-like domain-containing protein [Bradymonadaceae bacterium]
MKIDSFERLFVHTLKDLYSAEQQIIKALPKMEKAASTPQLKEAFQNHLDETKVQLERLKKIFEHLDFSPTGHVCEGIKGIIEEGKEIIQMEGIPSEVKDAALIEVAQKVEHYEIAGYGTAAHFAELLGDREAAQLLGETLEEEKKTDKKLNKLAKNIVNKQAIQKDQGEQPRAT